MKKRLNLRNILKDAMNQTVESNCQINKCIHLLNISKISFKFSESSSIWILWEGTPQLLKTSLRANMCNSAVECSARGCLRHSGYSNRASEKGSMNIHKAN